ncbi:DUF5681 domain-containing protein [uncultured Parasphingorhabdus sp.]|uniref:DUF5681 domain-containing protein n=1 Tax=uncultured Parasphingorhabdus sp. TaxID=2709694 RepID=UPI0030DC2B6D
MTKTPASADEKQDGKFRPGQSGNPAGKKPGTRNRITLAVEGLLGDKHKELTTAAIDAALAGDVQALRLCLTMIAPPRKDSPITMELPKIETVQDAVAASQNVLAAVAAGEVTPDEAARVMALLTAHKQLVETGDIERRLAIIEENRAAN